MRGEFGHLAHADPRAFQLVVLTRAASSAQATGFGEVHRALSLMERAPDATHMASLAGTSLLPLSSLSAIGGPIQSSGPATSVRLPTIEAPRFGFPPGYVPLSKVFL